MTEHDRTSVSSHLQISQVMDRRLKSTSRTCDDALASLSDFEPIVANEWTNRSIRTYQNRVHMISLDHGTSWAMGHVMTYDDICIHLWNIVKCVVLANHWQPDQEARTTFSLFCQIGHSGQLDQVGYRWINVDSCCIISHPTMTRNRTCSQRDAGVAVRWSEWMRPYESNMFYHVSHCPTLSHLAQRRCDAAIFCTIPCPKMFSGTPYLNIS